MPLTLADKIYKRHVRLYRELNDIHIFSSKTIPLLRKASKEHQDEVIDRDQGIKLSVPGKRGSVGVARRTPVQLSELFEGYADEGLFTTLLVSAVSKFEVYLSDVLAEFIRESPDDLNIGLKGGKADMQIPVDAVVKAKNLGDALNKAIDIRLQGVFYAKPKEYFAYFSSITKLGIKEDIIQPFFEIKATRDLVVHNSLIVNDQYIEKAGNLKRGELGTKLKIEKDYFEDSLSNMKTISSSIYNLTDDKYGTV